MTQPEPSTIDLRCDDGVHLRGRAFDAPEPHATVILAPAMLVKQQFYFSFARHLASCGLRAITYDNRGIGESLRPRRSGPRPRLEHWGERDLPAVIDHAERELPGAPLFLVGHSMGGQIVSLTPAMHRLAGIVTVAATAAYWGHWPAPHRFTILAWYLAIPFIGRALPVLPADWVGLGPNADPRVVRDWARWGRDPRYLHAPVGLNPQADLYEGSVLVYSFTDDEAFGCRAAVEALHEDYKRARLEHRHLSPADVGASQVGHFGFFRSRHGRALWEQTVAWIDDVISGSAAGT